jgi:hypothetical protein
MKIRKSKLATWGYIIAAGWFLAVSHARGETVNYATDQKAEATAYRTPQDMLDMVPGLKEIPKTITLGQGYLIDFGGNQLHVNYRTRESRKAKKQICTLGLSYTTPVAGFFSSQLNLPLMGATDLMSSDWSRNSLGDYEVVMNRMAVSHPILKLAFSAHF